MECCSQNTQKVFRCVRRCAHHWRELARKHRPPHPAATRLAAPLSAGTIQCSTGVWTSLARCDRSHLRGSSGMLALLQAAEFTRWCIICEASAQETCSLHHSSQRGPPSPPPSPFPSRPQTWRAQRGRAGDKLVGCDCRTLHGPDYFPNLSVFTKGAPPSLSPLQGQTACQSTAPPTCAGAPPSLTPTACQFAAPPTCTGSPPSVPPAEGEEHSRRGPSHERTSEAVLAAQDSAKVSAAMLSSDPVDLLCTLLVRSLLDALADSRLQEEERMQVSWHVRPATVVVVVWG